MKPLWLAAAVAVALFALITRSRRGRAERAGLMVAAAALAVYGAGLVVVPDVKQLIADLGQALGPYTYGLVAVLAFLETGAFVGLVAPGETAMIVGGVIAGQGEIRLGPLILIVWAAAVAGDSVSFLLGRRLGRDFLIRHGPRVKITEERLRQVEVFLDRRGGTTIVLGRFVGVVRAVAPFVLGASRMPYRRFLPYDILGAGLWAASFTVLGYVFWRSFDRVAEIAGRGALALATVIVVTVAAIALIRLLRHRDGRARARAWLDAQLERPALRLAAPTLRWLAARVVVPVASRLRGPAWFAARRLTPGGLGLEFTTVLAVLAVGGFLFVQLLVSVSSGLPVFGDRWAQELAVRLRTPLLSDLTEVLARFGALTVVAVATLLVATALVWRRRWADATVLALGLVLVQLAVVVTERAVARPRPEGGLVDAAGWAFPSAQAAHAVAWVALAVAVARAVPGLAGRLALVVGAVVATVVIGLAGVYLGVHALSDVAAGWALAAATYAICAAVALIVVHVRENGGRVAPK